MANERKTRIPLLFGTMTMGEEGKNGVRNSNLDECQGILNEFFSHGHDVLDTARMYAEGTTEAHLSSLDLKGAKIDTKVYPVNKGDHKPDALRKTFSESLEKLKVQKVRVFYLHAPDRSVPFIETLAEVNKLHEEGKFERFGLSNYTAWEVAEIVGICKQHGFVQPTIYQAMYNAITRAIEPELVPCLHKFKIELVVYNPLAGGFFAGKLASRDETPEPGRFSGESAMAKMYRARYFQDDYFTALNSLKGVAAKHNLKLVDIAMRWLQHHSALTPSDGIILGASSTDQLRQTCLASEMGPLPDEVVAALDDAWLRVGAACPPYWR